MKGLVRARLIKRYKRFLADVRLDSGEIITVYCPNTGSMKNCVEQGAEAWLSESNNSRRKYRFTWEYLKTSQGHFIGINSATANQLVKSAILGGHLEQLSNYRTVRPEVKYGQEGSRIDLLLQDIDLPDCYVEIKSVTLLESPFAHGIGYFPDAVSERASRHIRELSKMSAGGARAVLLFCVQHTGIREVRPADHIDSGYGKQLRTAINEGLEVLAYKVRKSNNGFRLWRQLRVVI
mgnify:CR=1 FL=1